MTSSSQSAPEARGSTEIVERPFNHAQTQTDTLYVKWWLHWRDGTELKDALHYTETLLDIEPAVRAGLLRRQGGFYQGILSRQGKKLDAEEAARCFLKALQYEPSDFLAMSGLSWVYLMQARVTGSHMMLDDAIALSENAIVQTPVDHEAYSFILSHAAMCLIQRSRFNGCHEDLEIAAQLLCVGLTLPNLARDHPATFRLQLAEIHLLQFGRLENLEDIDRVASFLGQVPSTYSVHTQNEPYLKQLRGRMYKAKWDFFRTEQDLADSFSAYATMYEPNSACPSWLKIDADLGCADVLRICWEYLKEDEYLSKSFLVANTACREARKRASEWHLSSSSRMEAQAQFIIGETLRGRYIRYRANQLLDDSISAFRQSVRMTDLKDGDFLERAFKLSSVLRMRTTAYPPNDYQRQADLCEARLWAGKSIWSRMPLHRWQHVACVLELGHLLWDSGAPVDRVIPLYQRAVDLDTMHFAFRVDSWLSLAKALISRGHNTKCIGDLDNAKAYLDKVEMLERERNNQFTDRLLVAASQQSEYYQLTGDLTCRLHAAYLNYTIFFESRYPFEERMKAVRELTGFYSWLADNWNSDIHKMLQTMRIRISDRSNREKVSQEAVDLIVQLLSECQDQAQQLFLIRYFMPMHMTTVFVAIILGKDPVTIVNALEKGRSIFWDRLINRRGQVVELVEKHEELASRYLDLRKRLEQTAQPDDVFKDQPQDKFLLASEMNDVIVEIRQQDGFEDFLLPPLEPSKLQAYGAYGPVVMLVAAPRTGYALVTSTDSIFILPLREYSMEACQEKFVLLQQASDLACYRENQAIAADLLYYVLTWLWESAAEPVLNRLGFDGSRDPSNGLPRVWWITCDWVNRLPIHAAGDHLRRLRTKDPCTVMDRVISSYSPTLKALMYSRTRMQELIQQSSTTTEPPTALLAAMEETMDRPRLEDAIREVKCVQPILEPQFHIRSFTNPPPTRKDIVTNLRKCTIAHLACHGEADPSDPLRSKILLQDWGPKPLRVAFIMKMDMENCQLAYLSACETAVNKDEELAEEGLHISGAFQMAGVPNTVATWWEINDQEAVAVAEGFYGRLKDEGGRIDMGRAAGALRGVLVEMRDAGVSPLVWGSYVHFGA